MSDRRGLSEGVAVVVSAVVGLAVAAASLWFVQGYNIFHENLFRVQPTVAGGGVGTDFVQGNSSTVLDWLIVLVHAADILMGLFILVMVFIHWASFRRLAARMKPPVHADENARTATDGGNAADTRGEGE
ncbi:hypothetical protein [Salarchaeum sp. JOR-1]|uniref:hypothetical protein n=1 Tax=Salarchaeum sp. JOR-1 TaxID=2599399 RepID=UPI0011986AEA|nr:hypothetical protein [Salarchaeum sp. JOR-1]QDX41396.1 hypothetical protein FQU85_10975 [Salarchaeum sp. JOR-1]